jgi:sugar lactone lactonase YvrE
MRLIAIAALSFAAACSPPQEDRTIGPEDAVWSSATYFTQLWVAEGFSDPEGVAAAPQGGYFISNVAGEGEAKDGEGWVSILSVDGEIVTARFVEGLDAPKGMAVLNGVLYVADIDQVRRYDAVSGEDLGAILVGGAKFLNDATVWQDAVFVSDSATSTIHRIDCDSATIWLEGDALSGVNGLLGTGDKMLVTTMDSGSLLSVTKDGEITEIAKGMKNADGVGVVPDGGWLVSSWPGAVFLVSPGGSWVEMINTREEGVFQNDLTMFGDIVIVPNWKPGTVTAWKIVHSVN